MKTTRRQFINDHEVALERSSKLEEQIGMIWLTGAVRHEALREGPNQVKVLVAASSTSPFQLTGLELLQSQA
jgi:hypothetical protein